MSGGHFDYNNYHLKDMSDELLNLIRTNGKSKEDDYGYVLKFTDETLRIFFTTSFILRLAEHGLHEIDYMISGDTSEENLSDAISGRALQLIRDEEQNISQIVGPEFYAWILEQYEMSKPKPEAKQTEMFE